MTMVLRAWLLVVCAGVAVRGGRQPANYFVDLTTAAPVGADASGTRVPEDERLRMDAIVRSHEPPLPYPDLAVTLDSLDTTSWVDGSPFVVEMTITNVGNGPLGFPIGVDNTQLSWKDAGAVAAELTLEFHDALLGRGFPFAVDLFGAIAKAGTVVTLMPRESVRIRGQGRWRAGELRNPENLRSEAGSVVRVAARVELRPFGRRYAPVTSANQVQVTLRPR
jgi:hypothetical protein